MVISSEIWASKAKNSQTKPLMGNCEASFPMWQVKGLDLLCERSKERLATQVCMKQCV
jgi:hypothetical protein